MRFNVHQDSHIGGRTSNQDRAGYCFTRDALLMLLADGMGGHARGELAASLAVQTMGALFQERAQPAIPDPVRFIDDLIFAAHHELHRCRAVNRLPDTPRTTIVICLIQYGHAYWAHCGDSRLYWLRNGRVMARTLDHSHVEFLIMQGRLPASARLTHPDRNKLFNCLGAPTLPRVDKAPTAALKPGDQILLCSDGLWSSLAEHELAYRLTAQPLTQAIPALVQSATVNAGKSSDNVTALGLTWLGEEAALPDAPLSSAHLPADSLVTTILAARHADLEDPGAAPAGDSGGTRDIERAFADMHAKSKPEQAK